MIDQNIILIVGSILAIAWTMYQEIRHVINHGTMSPRVQRISDAIEKRIEADILSYLKDKNLLNDHHIQFSISKKK